MDQEQLLQKALPLLGGRENVSRTAVRSDDLYITVKDAGVVDLETLGTLEGVEKTEYSRNRIALRQKEESLPKEGPDMAKKKLNYSKVAENIIANVGGKENISSVRHCITRVRFRLKDEGKADDSIVKDLEGVISVVHGGGEYMVVIGDAVADVYEAVCNQLGMAGGVAEEGKDQQDKTNPALKLLNTVVASIGPCLNLVCAGGIVKGLLSLLEMSSMVPAGTGMHTLIMAIGCTVSFAQIGVVLAMYLKSRDEELKGIALPAFLSGIFGVTEPAIYGVTLPRIKMFVLSCIGGAVCGAFISLTGTTMYQFTGLGVFAILGLLSPETPKVVMAILCAVVPFAFSFLAGFVLYKEEIVSEDASDQGKTIQGRAEIEAPVAGQIVPLSEVPDETFSGGMLGHGFAVEPTEGKVYAPFDGVCEMMFDTLHAMGLRSDQGVALLIHVGLETVSLNGKPFTAHVKSGDRITRGQLLLEFDMDAIRVAGCSLITPVLVTNEGETGSVTVEEDRLIVGA